MAGVRQLMKQAQRMQKKMEEAQEKLAAEELEVSCGGGAVTVRINGQGEFRALNIDPELLEEDKEMVESTLLEAIQEAAKKAKALNEQEMEKIQSGLKMPGLM
ncbi:MAG: YbaB/EbfC family nucleoid-associated protein [Verrucomicrobiota bacterium]